MGAHPSTSRKGGVKGALLVPTHPHRPESGLHADHKIKCCGQEITVPVLDIDMEAQDGLNNEDF